MIRLALLTRSEIAHRELRDAVREIPDLSVALHLRSARELSSASGLDVLVAAWDLVDDVPALVARLEPTPLLALGEITRPEWELLVGRLDGAGQLTEFDTERVIAASRAVSTGLLVTESAEMYPERASMEVASDLTGREREVLELVAHGRTNSQIAEALGLSSNTVKYHLAGLFAKLGAQSRSEATWHAIKKGIITL